jgi:hypothetical protein
MLGGRMDSQHAKRLMIDVISIVLAWNERLLTDKQAMNKIIGSLLTDKNNQNENNYKKTSKKSAGLLAIAASLGIVLFIFVVSVDVFTSSESIMLAENEKIGFELLGENPSESKEKMLNDTIVEEFNTPKKDVEN